MALNGGAFSGSPSSHSERENHGIRRIHGNMSRWQSGQPGENHTDYV